MPNLGATVIICTLNREASLLVTLDDLLAQDYESLEILIVDQSKDKPEALASILSSHPSKVSYHNVSFRGLPKARNYGWQHARYEHVIYVDDDIRCDKDFVSNHMSVFARRSCAIVAGGVDQEGSKALPEKKVGRFSRWTATPHQGFSFNGEKLVDHGVGCNFATTQTWLKNVGGFDERFGEGTALYEEADFCLRVKRLGGNAIFSGAARLTHLAAADGGCRVNRLHKYIYSLCRNKALLMSKHLKKYHYPTAFLVLAKTILAYTVVYRSLKSVQWAFQGVREGLRLGAHNEVSTSFVSKRGAA